MFNTINNLSFDNVEIKTRLNNTNENVQKIVERVLVDEIEQKANRHRISKNTTHCRRNTKTLTRIDIDLENETLTNAPTTIIGNDSITLTATDLRNINSNIILDNQEQYPIKITILETYNMDEDMLVKVKVSYTYNENTDTGTEQKEGYKIIFYLGKYDKENNKMNITKLNFDNLTYSTFSNGTTEGQYDTNTELQIPEFGKYENDYAIIGFCVIDGVKYIMCYYSVYDSGSGDNLYYIIFYNVVDNREGSTLKGLAISIPFGPKEEITKSWYNYKKYSPVELTAKDASPYLNGILLEFPNKIDYTTDTYKRVLLRIAPEGTNKFAYNPYIATITDGSNNITDLLHVQGHITQINKEDYNIYYYAIINGKIYIMDNDFTKFTSDTEAKTITIQLTKTLFNNAEGSSIKTFSSFSNINIANLIDYRYTNITTDDTLHYLVKGIVMVEYDNSTQTINYYYPTIKKNATTDIYEKYTINLANKDLSNIRTSDALINISCNGSLFNSFDKDGIKYYYLTRENKELYLWNIKDFLFSDIADTYLWCNSNVDFFNAIIINSPSINKDLSEQFLDISVSYVIHRCYPVDMIKSFKSDNSITHINKIPNVVIRERSSAKARSVRTFDLRKNKDVEEVSEISKSYSSYSDDTTTTTTTTVKTKQEQQKQPQKQPQKQRGGFWRRRTNNPEQSDISERSVSKSISRSASNSRRRFGKI